VYRKAVQFIKNNQKADGSFEEAPAHSTSLELRTALALNALLASPGESDFDAIDRGIMWLLKKQRADGGWSGGYYPGKVNKKEDIFATAMASLALQRYKQKRAAAHVSAQD